MTPTSLARRRNESSPCFTYARPTTPAANARFSAVFLIKRKVPMVNKNKTMQSRRTVTAIRLGGGGGDAHGGFRRCEIAAQSQDVLERERVFGAC